MLLKVHLQLPLVYISVYISALYLSGMYKISGSKEKVPGQGNQEVL